MPPAWQDLNPAVVRQLLQFGLKALDAGRSPAALSGDLNRLTWLARELRLRGASDDLLDVTGNLTVLHAVFRESHATRRGEMSQRLRSYDDFLTALLPPEQAGTGLRAVRAGLIPRLGPGGEVDMVPGGRGERAPTWTRPIFPAGLNRICEAAGGTSSEAFRLRDESLVRVLAWSHFQWGEVLRLRWEDIVWSPNDEDPFGAWVETPDGKKPIHRLGSNRLALLFAIEARLLGERPTGPAFHSMKRPYRPLSPVHGRRILNEALAGAGYPGVTRRDMLAAYGYHLRVTYGFSVSDLVEFFGYKRSANVMALLESYRAVELDAVAEERGAFGE
jgi:integrase